MGIVYPDELAKCIVSVGRGCAVSGFGNDVAAIVIGVREGDTGLLDRGYQRSGAARAIAAANVAVSAAQGAGGTRGDLAKIVVGVVERVFPIESHDGDAVVGVIGVGGAELLGRQGFLQRGQTVLGVVLQTRAVDQAAVGVAQLGVHQPVGK